MQSIRLAVENTERYKAELRDFLSSVQVISAYAAPIPDVSALEKRDADNGDYEPESHLYGQFATEKAIRALTSFYAPSGTNTFHPLLTPGLVQVPRAPPLESNKLARIVRRDQGGHNGLRLEFRALGQCRHELIYVLGRGRTLRGSSLDAVDPRGSRRIDRRLL